MDLVSHLSFSVSNLQASIEFYDAVLGTLGYRRVFTGPVSAGWGPSEDREVFAVKKRIDRVTAPSPGFHLAFHAAEKDIVHHFHAAALNHGGRDNGAPGPRPQYGPHYYAAFITDPDGYQLEAKFFVG